MVARKRVLSGVSISSRVAERGWSGKEAAEDLQDLRAQVRKLRERTFIFLFLLFSNFGYSWFLWKWGSAWVWWMVMCALVVGSEIFRMRLRKFG
jgi:hypothetical protein